MSQRTQPDLSTDSGSGYRRSGAPRGSSSPRGGKGGGKSGGTGRMIGMNLIMALLIAGLVLSGWFIANQQQLLAEERERSDSAEQRLERLEARLIATDSALSQEGDQTKQQIGLWESEIRKLWDVSNKRNKKWIEDNRGGVARLSKTIDGLEAKSRDLNAAVGRHESAFEQQQALIDQLASLELQMQQIVRGQRDLVDKVNSTGQSVASMRASVAGKVDENAEAIAAIDAYRVAVNSRLAEIERRINGLAGVTGGL